MTCEEKIIETYEELKTENKKLRKFVDYISEHCRVCNVSHWRDEGRYVSISLPNFDNDDPDTKRWFNLAVDVLELKERVDEELEAIRKTMEETKNEEGVE